MSRSRFPAPLGAILISISILLAGCAERGSADYYDRLEAKLVAKRKLRTDTTPVGFHYDAEDLARNFRRVAFYHEADATKPGSESNWQGNPLKRWEGPIDYAVLGTAVTESDRAEIARLMERITRLTGLKIAETETGWNFLILITAPEERAHYSQLLAQTDRGLAATFDLWRTSRSVICIANDPFSYQDGSRLSDGLVAIGSETRGLLRRSCLHEEIVQSLGLANDHPEVRPSIFNDDGEFALLTEHDEHLLRILYDSRLKVGMTADEAMPIVRRIAATMMPDRPHESRTAEARTATGANPPATQDVPTN